MIFVDTNVIIDVLEADPVWQEWSIGQLARHERLLTNGIVLAELAGSFVTLSEATDALSLQDIELLDLPPEAAFAAGHAFRRYRRSGTERLRLLPDFLVGAHAELLDAPLLTRDTRLYRRYFPDLTLIAPDTV